jgi:hypothetical protein
VTSSIQTLRVGIVYTQIENNVEQKSSENSLYHQCHAIDGKRS